MTSGWVVAAAYLRNVHPLPFISYTSLSLTYISERQWSDKQSWRAHNERRLVLVQWRVWTEVAYQEISIPKAFVLRDDCWTHYGLWLVHSPLECYAGTSERKTVLILHRYQRTDNLSAVKGCSLPCVWITLKGLLMDGSGWTLCAIVQCIMKFVPVISFVLSPRYTMLTCPLEGVCLYTVASS